MAQYNLSIMLLGVHISGVDKIYKAFDCADKLGCNTMQIFARSPQRWREHSLDAADIEEFKKRREKFKISPVFIHISYLINLASPNPGLYKASIQAYIEDIVEAYKLKADYIVTHMGSHKETTEAAGIKRLIAALNQILEATGDSPVKVLLENTAGSGSWLGYKFSHHEQILEGIKQKDRIGLCLDTAHAYLAGYDISNKDGLGLMLDEIDRLVGLGLIKLVHLNDAKGELGSHHDRHDHLGKGGIGLEGIRDIINHQALKNVPFILETPKDSEDADKINLMTVRRLRKK